MPSDPQREPRTLEELVARTRVPVEEQVEERDPSPGGPPDDRLPQPDRGWFESGG
jgi:hypothetical protein